MKFTEDNCNAVKDLFDNDKEKDGMKMLMTLINSYQQKYDLNNKENIINDFRNDTKLIFNVFYNSIASEKMIKDLEEELDDRYEVDRKDKKEYMDFVGNINVVLQKIDTVDLLNPDTEYTTNCKNAMSYINQKQHDMIGLRETMSKLIKQLESVVEAFTPVPTIESLAIKPP
jgi:hypothetical protein